MRISVILPAHNAKAYIAEAIDSVLEQSRPPDELIVVDDGSTDGTQAVIEGYGDRIKCIRQPNAGSTKALNVGLAAATGDIFGFQDHDDIWTPGRLAKQLDVLAADPAIEAVFGMVRQFVSPELPSDIKATYQPRTEVLRGENRAPMIIRRAAFERVGTFDESYPVVGGNVEWLARARAANLRSVMLDEVVLMRRLHQGNGGRVAAQAQTDETLLALKKAMEARRRRP